MRIFVSNDDGIHAKGIFELAKAMRSMGDVVVVAPDRQRSASSHGISLHDALYAKQVDFGLSGVEAWSVTGTPVDCVKWGMVMLGAQQSFDFMVSGINEGANMATDVLYSGTVAAAAEAALLGVPSIAFSLVAPPYPFSEAADIALNLVTTVQESKLPPDTFLNVNLPSAGIATAKWRMTQLGARSYRNDFIQVTDAAGQVCYRHAGEELEETRGEDADVMALRRNEISITPLTYRFTNHEMLDSLKTWMANMENRMDG